jgi:hypothetical protein
VCTTIVLSKAVKKLFVGENEKVFAPQKVGFYWAVATLLGNGVICVYAVAAI